MDDFENDDKDDCKRKSRNLSEKKRRDQFNVLINELCSIVSNTRRKLDKSSVLKATVAFLRTHNEVSARSQSCEIQEIWKPIFLCNEEFTHIMLEALDGFILVMLSSGKLLYLSESITALLGYHPSEIFGASLYEFILEEDKNTVYHILHNLSSLHFLPSCKNQEVSPMVFMCHLKRKCTQQEEVMYELVRFQGFHASMETSMNFNTLEPDSTVKNENKTLFVAMGRFIQPQLLKEINLKSGKSEFTSRHSLEWKFLFLDHRAPPIIGYLPFEVLGTSGYDYYHADDLDKISTGHEQLMMTGEGTSCPYRFLTKGQQWVWLQTRYYITYHQWTSKPEFVVCTHTIIPYPTNISKANADFNYEDYWDSVSNRNGKHRSYNKRKEKSADRSRKLPSSSKLSSHHSNYESVDFNYVISSPSSSAVSSQGSAGVDKMTDQGEDHMHDNSLTSDVSTNYRPNDVSTNYRPNDDYSMNSAISSGDVGQSSRSVSGSMGSQVMHDHLKQRYSEIQDQIARQQEELQQIQEQLINVQYGYGSNEASNQLGDQCSTLSSQMMYPGANDQMNENYGMSSMHCQVPDANWTSNCQGFSMMEAMRGRSNPYPGLCESQLHPRYSDN